MQSEAVKDMVRDMETIETLLGNKGRFVGDMVHISIKDLAQRIAAQSPASAVEDNEVVDKAEPYFSGETYEMREAVEAIKKAGFSILKSPEGV